MAYAIRTKGQRLKLDDLDYLAIVQFAILHVTCVLAFWAGISWAAVVACLIFYFLRIFGLSAGYHRYFAHRSFKTSRFFQFVLALLGASAYQKGPLWWAAHHRYHHIHSDTEQDVHSPVKSGFWWAHCGWIFSLKNRGTDEKMVPNLAKHWELRLIDDLYVLPPLLLAVSIYGLGVLLERYLPGLNTSGFQMLVWGFFVSTMLVHHGTYSANSMAHSFGRRRFNTRDGSRNNLFVALITLGDGWHNNHHHYPHSVRHGFYWWEIDVTHYILKGLSLFKVVWDLQTPPRRIYESNLSRSG